MNKHPVLTGISVAAVFCAMLLVGAEIFYRFHDTPKVDAALSALEKTPHPLTGKVMNYDFSLTGNLTAVTQNYYYDTPDENLGRRPRPNAHARLIETQGRRLFAGAKVVRDVRYDFDAFQRRITPGQERGEHERFIAFFGCSFTFGEAVDQKQTMPYYVAQLAPGHRAYNYGLPGYGTNSVLALLQNVDLAREIPEKQGILIYTFIDDHVRRTIGSMSLMNSWGQDLPFYERDSHGRVVRNHTLATGRPLRTWIYAQLGKSALLRHLNFDYPWWISTADLELVAALIAEARDEFERKLPGNQFFMLIYPESRLGDRLIPFLEQRRIHVLDYSRLDMRGGPTHKEWIPGMKHPSAYAYKTLSEQLVRTLRLK